jgi:hypothetical protein
MDIYSVLSHTKAPRHKDMGGGQKAGRILQLFLFENHEKI